MPRQTLVWRMVSILTIGLVVWLSGGCSPAAPSAEQPSELRIGLLATLTGDAAETTGKPTVQGAQLAVQRVNDEGGLVVGGHKLKVTLLIEDDHDTSTMAVDAARKLISQENVVAIVGPAFSRNAIPVADVAESAQVPMISPTSTNPATTAGKRYVFRAVFLDSLQAQVLARFAHDELRAQRVAVLYDIASAYNKELAENFKQALEGLGSQVVAFESYTTDANRDLTHQLERIRESQPDLLFLPNYASEVPYQVEQARKLGINAGLLGSDTWGSMASADITGLDGAFFSGFWAADIEGEQAKRFIETYQQTYGVAPNDQAAMTYDSLGILFAAIERQGRADPEAIRAGIAGTTSYSGVTGTISYHEGSGDPVRSVVILQIRDGQMRFYRLVDPT